MRSLVLIGHGSRQHPETALQRAAEALRGRGAFSDVVEGYWQQEPSLRQVLRTTTSTDVTVVPMFLTDGYLTETVLPRELGLGFQGEVPEGGVARVLGGRSVRYTRPYGTHPAMQEVILARAQEALAGHSPQQATLVLVGQTAPGHTGSETALHTHAAALRERGLFADVQPLLLDSPASLDSPAWQALQALTRTEGTRVVVVPFFPSEQARSYRWLQEHLGGRNVALSAPVGTHPGVADVLLQLVEAGRPGGDLDQTHSEAWQTLLSQLQQPGAAQRGLRLGEVLIRPLHGVYDLRHMLDEGRASGDLQTVVTPEGLRDLTAHDDAGHYRPVRTWRTLPRGWRAVLSQADLPLALHLLYPAAVEETSAYRQHNLHCTPWPSTARRQTGSFAKVQRATPQQVEAVTARVCASCLRTPLWAGKTLGQTFLDGVPGGLPCAEACMALVASVRDELNHG